MLPICISILTSSKSMPISPARTFQNSVREKTFWLEAGWFWGRLGRENLLVLSRGEIEFPSDLTRGLKCTDIKRTQQKEPRNLRAYLGS